MTKKITTGLRAYQATWSAVALCIALVTACSQQPSQKTNLLTSQAQIQAPESTQTKLDSGTDVRTLKGHTEWVISVAFSPTEQILASAGSADKKINLWDVKTATLFRTLTSNYVVLSVAFSPEGKILATSGGSHPNNVGEIILWDTQTWNPIKILSGHKDKVLSVTFSPDGKTLASGSQDKTVKLWDIQTGELKQTLTGHTDTVSSVAFSPDGKTLASGSKSSSDAIDESVKLWNVETGALKLSLPKYGPPVMFSPDGKTLAAEYEHEAVKLLDSETAIVKQFLENNDRSILVSSIAFSPDGKTLAGGGQEGNVYVWDVESGILKRTLKGHSRLVESVTFSPDGKTLASGSDDLTIKLWTLSR